MTLVGRPALNHPQQTAVRGALERVDDRRTPRDLWEDLHGEFGLDLDVAASAGDGRAQNTRACAMVLRLPSPSRRNAQAPRGRERLPRPLLDV